MPWNTLYNERLETGLLSTKRRSNFSLIGPQISQKCQATADIELKSEGDRNRQ